MKLPEYKEYIVKNGFVFEEKAKFYENWVIKFLKLNISDKLSEQDRINQF